ncbi:protein kinase [Stieleria sp. TO1_6]|uniref:protein kinase domain-containing protein n=1 Tax=Stieleria tagensis TaxID=2956795 RepID=UPI00209B76CC|nr:protein kinase [Stieleria tagensis]MCO8124054.1 protein kinase [Stieleria tagensis]
MDLDEIATHALTLDDPEKRRAYLDSVCAGDSALRKKAESLIAALIQTDEDRFLSSGLFPGVAGTATQSCHRSTGNDDAPSGNEATAITPTSDASRFEIRSKHALGGLGEVWVAWDRQLGREVALKQMRPEWAGNLHAESRFRREAEITGYLEHPGIVPIYSLGDQADGRPFYAMQFIRGRTLEQVVAECIAPGTWYDNASLRRMLDHFVDVCQTIDYAHSKHVIHRDLKPANIMLGAYGQTLVVDWGLAKRIDQSAAPSPTSPAIDQEQSVIDATLCPPSANDSSVEQTQQGTTMGTPRYMSPEQAAGKTEQIGPPADVYCLGATLYFVLVGRPPHMGQADLKSTIRRILAGEFEPPGTACPHVPRPLQAIVMKAMAIDPQQRYSGPGKLADDLQNYLDDQPVSVFPDPPLDRLLRWTRKNRAISAALAVGCLLTLLATISGLLIRQEMNRREVVAARQKEADQQQIQLQEQTRRLEAVAAADAAIDRAEAALGDSRYADAAALLGVALDRMENQDSLALRRNKRLAQQQRLIRLGKFESLYKSGEDLDHLARDTEAAILLQESLEQLGVWDSQTWWQELPDDDLTPLQSDRLRWQVYRILTALDLIYLKKMAIAMGGDSAGGMPSILKIIRSFLSTNVGASQAQATVELTKRINTFRPGEAARWLGSIASARLRRGTRIDARELGPPQNPDDGRSLAVFSLIASVDPAYRSWFSGYGDRFAPPQSDSPSLRCLNVALETLRRVSDEASDDYWIRLTLAQAYFLLAQHSERQDDYDAAIEHYELARSEYGRCIAIRPDAAFGHADRSTVALRQAVLMRDHHSATAGQRQRAGELLRASFRDASQARRLAPAAHWVYWHLGATAIELGQDEAAIGAFFKAVDLAFDVEKTIDSPFYHLDELRGRTEAIEFAYQASDQILAATAVDPTLGTRSALIASLEYVRGKLDPALQWADRAVSLDPTNWRAHRVAGWCQLRNQNRKQAQQHFQAALAQSPDDAVCLIGAARIAEQNKQNDPSQVDRWYRQVIGAQVSHRLRATAWLGLGKNAMTRAEFDETLDAIRQARQLEPACDLSQFVEMTRQQASQLIRRSKKTIPAAEQVTIKQQLSELKFFLDQITEMPVASVNQILRSASDHPPATLPLLGADFELPIERYWELQPIRSNDRLSAGDHTGSPPLAITSSISHGGNSSLMIQRTQPDHATSDWRLRQTIPATPGHRYRLTATVKSNGNQTSAVEIQIAQDEQTLLKIPMPANSDDWALCQDEFSISASDETTVPLRVEIIVSDPKSSTFYLDDFQIDLVDATRQL